MRYCETSDIESYMLIEIDDSFAGEVNKFIEQSSREIDQSTDRTFGLEGDDYAVEKIYDGNGRKDLIIDDLVSLESVEINDQTVDALAYPANKTPKTSLYLESGFTRGRQNVSVTGSWGWPEVPPPIVHACIVLTAQKILVAYEGGNEIVREKIGEYEIQYARDKKKDDFENVESILNGFKRYAL